MTDVFKQHGAFSWNELMTTDVAAAKRFYNQIFGWEFTDEQMEEGTYTIVKVDGKEIAGMMKMPPEAGDAHPAWGVYVTVTDVDDTARKVADLGGKIFVPPRDIPNVGRFCVFQDPQGAFISAISYSMKA